MVQYIYKFRHASNLSSRRTLLFQNYWHLSGCNER